MPSKKIFEELCSVYGKCEVSFETVTRWVKKFKSGQSSVQDDPKAGRPCSVVNLKNIARIREILEKDARYTVQDLAHMTSISSGSIHKILRKHLGVRRITARWIPHLLSDKEKQQRVSMAKKLLKMYPKYDQRKFADICTGDETWVHFLNFL